MLLSSVGKYDQVVCKVLSMNNMTSKGSGFAAVVGFP